MAKGLEQSMRMLAVPVAGHEAEGGVDVWVEDFEGELVLLGDAGPVEDAGSAEGVDGELERPELAMAGKSMTLLRSLT